MLRRDESDRGRAGIGSGLIGPLVPLVIRRGWPPRRILIAARNTLDSQVDGRLRGRVGVAGVDHLLEGEAQAHDR